MATPVQCYAQAAKYDLAALDKLKGKQATKVAPSFGSNGITYDNYDHLKVARALDANIQFIISGTCPANIKSCIKKKCPTTTVKICAIEMHEEVRFRTKINTYSPKSNKAKALSAENIFSLNNNNSTSYVNSTSDSGSGSYEISSDEQPYTDGDDFYFGMDLMGSSGSSSGGSMNGTILSPMSRLKHLHRIVL
ncbi:hypothetical protein THRCLA_07308 [Thraustotheca clavata]|uniref:Uncharacterized protein n=1 Tax=Thraustotheca clavata TaxID=74557 RepID=A0A1V9ZED0_9STRA|nr:hypothetical protein THRCLA_07308 [Thraustotheca clavata]